MVLQNPPIIYTQPVLFLFVVEAFSDVSHKLGRS